MAAATVVSRLPTPQNGGASGAKLLINSLSACRLPDQELWEGQHDIEMLMLDG